MSSNAASGIVDMAMVIGPLKKMDYLFRSDPLLEDTENRLTREYYQY